MTNTKLSKLLLAWLTSQGHKVLEYEESKGIATRFGNEKYRFDISGSFGGIRVTYDSGVFSFYDGEQLIKETNLNEFH